MSIVTLRFSPADQVIDVGTEKKNVRDDVEKVILRSLIHIGWQNAKSLPDFKAFSELDDLLKKTTGDDMAISSEDAERLASVLLEKTPNRPLTWLSFGRGIIDQITAHG
jgi:hypothetical protein